MLQHMAHPGAAFQALDEKPRSPTPQVCSTRSGSQAVRRSFRPGSLLEGKVLQLAQIQPDLEDGAVGPDAGAAQEGGAQQLDIFEFGQQSVRVEEWGGAGLALPKRGVRGYWQMPPAVDKRYKWTAAPPGPALLADNAVHGHGALPQTPLRARAEYKTKCNINHLWTLLVSLPGPAGAELRAMLAPDENVQAAFEVDLTPELRFAPVSWC